MELSESVFEKLVGCTIKSDRSDGDKRQADRVPLNRRASLLLDGREGPLGVIVRDISRENVGILSPLKLSNGQTFTLELPTDSQPITLYCCVTQSQSGGSGGTLYVVGATFRPAPMTSEQMETQRIRDAMFAG